MAKIETIGSAPKLPAPPLAEHVTLLYSKGIALNPSEFFTADDLQYRTAYAGWVGFRLMIASWHQKPAGSLPNDDRALFRLSRWGKFSEFEKHRAEILEHWYLCADGRLYHPYVTERVRDCWRPRKRALGLKDVEDEPF